MKEIVFVFFGGGIGSVLRYTVGKFLFPLYKTTMVGTFASNFIACLVLGFFSNLILEKTISDSTYRPLLLIGLCGGLSTFSTFSFEVLEMFKNEQYINSFTYIIASLILCTASVFLGIFLSKYFV